MTAARETTQPGSHLAKALFRPEGVALVGASDDPRRATYRPLDFLRRRGWAGAVYPINPKRAQVRGEQAWPTVSDLPTVPDHAFIMAPKDAVVPSVLECGQLGVAVATILSDGFAESGPEGVERQEQLVEAAHATGIRVLGPNSLGLVDFRSGFILTANAFFEEDDARVGNIVVASQSGSLIGSLTSRAGARGIGFAAVISVGGEADLSIGEICGSTLDDPEVGGYLLFLETIRHADALAAFAASVSERGKPIVAYKLGRSQVAAGLAMSHTGALAGDDDVANQFLADCGIARVQSLEGLIEALPLLEKLPIRPSGARNPQVGIITTTGGGAAMVVDQLGVRGITVRQPDPGTYERLAEAGVQVARGAIVDLTLAGVKPEIMGAALDVLLTAPEFDAVVAVAGSSARTHPELLVEPIVAASRRSDRTLAAFLVPEAPVALARLTEAGVPTFHDPESCADAFAAAFARRPARRLATVPRQIAGPVRALDEPSSYAVLSGVGIPVAPSAVLEVEAVLRGASPVELPFGYPVVVKVVAEGLAHKSDVGGVRLGARDHDELVEATRAIVAELQHHHPELHVAQVLVQPMVAGLGEVLVGYRVDPNVGPVVVLAAGGVTTELRPDQSIRLAPISTDQARAMFDEIASLGVLRGFRKRPAGDVDALLDAVCRISQLMHHPEVVEAEINPLLVHEAGAGVEAVDAVVRTTGPSEPVAHA